MRKCNDYGKLPVFGILQRGGKAYTEIVARLRSKDLASHYPRQSGA